jgi:RNA polymerase primary sigma factor
VEIETIDLEQLVNIGRQQGFLTYEQVSQYLPDEANTAEKLDQLLIALERAGVGIVDEAETDVRSQLKIYNGEDMPSNLPSSPTIPFVCI